MTSAKYSDKELDTGLDDLLRRVAEENGANVSAVVGWMNEGGESGNDGEIANRLETMPRLAAILKNRPVDTEALRKVCSKIWALGNQQDSARRSTFLKSPEASEIINELLYGEGDGLARIDGFIDAAVKHGYTDPKGKDKTTAAQFASVLLSALYPERYVDFRANRWNTLYRLVTNTNQNLCSAGSLGRRIIGAGEFAAQLAETATFQHHFGAEHGTWKVAGLAWALRNGISGNGMPEKRYWAGGIKWGDIYKDKEFRAENYWQIGFPKHSKESSAKQCWKLFAQISIGDEFAIKGLGGTHDLTIHYIGRVLEIDADNGRLELKPLDKELYQGKAPTGSGAGNWHRTLVPVTKPDIIEMIFGENAAQTPKRPSAPDLPLNVIYHGPPGTGKTYHILSELAPQLFTDHQETQDREQYAEELMADLSWWRAVALAMLDLEKAKVADILDHPLMKVKTAQSENAHPRAAIWAHLQLHAREDCPNVKYARRSEPALFWKDEKSLWSIDMEVARNTVPELMDSLHSYKTFTAKQITEKRYSFVTFHQSYSYEDFVEGIRPVMAEDDPDETLRYEIKPGIFREICNKARRNPDKRYALFIDEINRGNIANILGELITLIEPDKRLGAENAVTVELPYSRTTFGVPDNLWIIGTMNTADRSVEALDTALRRRFAFKEMEPNIEVLAADSVEGVDLRRLLSIINGRIERLMDRDHRIGHSCFMQIASLADLRRVFRDHVMPLLQEYFYGDIAKVGMVLGERFVQRESNGVELAKGDWGIEDFDIPDAFRIVSSDKLTAEDFQSIYA